MLIIRLKGETINKNFIIQNYKFLTTGSAIEMNSSPWIVIANFQKKIDRGRDRSPDRGSGTPLVRTFKDENFINFIFLFLSVITP